MSDTPLYDQLAEKHGVPDPAEPEYLEQVESLPDDDYPDLLDTEPTQLAEDDGVDGNSTPNGGI